MEFDKLLGEKGLTARQGGVASFVFHVAAVSDKIAVGFMSQDLTCLSKEKHFMGQTAVSTEPVCGTYISA